MHIRRLRSIVGLAILLACGGNSVTILGYTVTIKTAPPATAPVGTAVPIAFTITETESDGTSKPASGKSFTVAVTTGGGTVGGATSTTVTSGADGSASLTWTLGPTVGTQTLRGSVASTQYLDVSVTATAAAASQLAVTTQPSTTATTGLALAQQPVVQLEDAAGNNFSQSGVVITAAIAAGTGTTGGTTTAATNSTGAATFSTLTVNGVTGSVTLRFSAPLEGTTVAVTSQAITVAAPQLFIVTQPATSAMSGLALARQPVIQLKDASGTVNLTQAGITITASIASGGGAATGATTANTDATGLAAFASLAVNGVTGNVTLRFAATVNGQAVAVNSQAIAEVPANQLGITTAPTSSPNSALPIFTQPVVQLQDGAGVALQQAGVAVTVSKAAGAGTVGLLTGGVGSLTVNTDASGLAVFHDLVLTGAGATTLQFTATGFTTATTASLNVLGAPTVTPLVNSVQVGPLVVSAGGLSYYTFQTPAGTVSLDIATFGGSGNSELYIRRGLQPTTADFDCRANLVGPSQICTFSTNLTGQYFVAVRAATGLSGSTIRANGYGVNCAAKGAMAIGVQTNGILDAATGCTVEQKQTLHDRYTLTVPVDQALALTVNTNSNTNTAYVAFRLPGNQLTYWTPFSLTPATVSPLLLGAGTYDVLVGDAAFNGATRSYSVKFAAISPNPVGCKAVFPNSGPVTMTMLLSVSDCPGTTPGKFSHRATLILGTGQSVTVTMASAAFDPLVNVLSGSTIGAGAVLAFDDNSGGGTTARLTFTNNDATNDAVITLELTSALAAATGSYSLTLSFSPAYYQSLRPPPGITPALLRVPGAPGGP